MQIETRLRRVENTLKASSEREYNTVVFVDRCSALDSYIVTISGVKHQGTKEGIGALLEPYIIGGSTIIWDDIAEMKD